MKAQFKIDIEKISIRRVIANEFNFKPSKVSAQASNSTSYCFKTILFVQIILVFFRETALYKVVSVVIKNLKNNKASDIPIIGVKISDHVIAPILARPFNDCMNRGIFRDSLNVGK